MLDASLSMNDDVNAVAVTAAAAGRARSGPPRSTPSTPWQSNRNAARRCAGLGAARHRGHRRLRESARRRRAGRWIARRPSRAGCVLIRRPSGGVAGGTTRQTRGAVDAAELACSATTDSNDDVIVPHDRRRADLQRGRRRACRRRHAADGRCDHPGSDGRVLPTFVAASRPPVVLPATALNHDGQRGGRQARAAGARQLLRRVPLSAGRAARRARAVVDNTGRCTFELPPPPSSWSRDRPST